jgi:hypothetical protein
MSCCTTQELHLAAYLHGQAKSYCLMIPAHMCRQGPFGPWTIQYLSYLDWMDLDTVKFNLDWIWMIMLEWTLVGHLTIWIWTSIQFQAPRACL